MGIVFLIVLVIVIAVLVIVFFIERKKDGNSNKPTTDGLPPDITETPITNEEPEKPQEQAVVEEPKEEEPKEQVLEDFLEEKFKSNYKGAIQRFQNLLGIEFGPLVKKYLYLLYNEVAKQYCRESSTILPLMWYKDNFPTACDYWKQAKTEVAVLDNIVGWLFAIQLAELIPEKREELLQSGYEVGLDTKDIYGYDFEYDPNVARILAGAIYAGMKGKLNPDIKAMREELGTSGYEETLNTILESDSGDMSSNFYVDFRKFLPSALGPYAPGYKNNRRDTTNDVKDDYGNAAEDRNIHEYIVENYNLDNPDHYQEVVQAIADKDGDMRHIFGKNRTVGEFSFHPVFGEDTIGVEISSDGAIAELAKYCQYICSYSREILQSKDTDPKEYGRLRPGCSWNQETVPNSNEDPRRNVLVNFQIEDNDGHPTGYYDENGKWVHPEEVASEEDYVKLQQESLWANSYPSGHSAGIIGVAMVLIELMPDKADLILKAANQFATNRTIARYHWTSDTIQGRVLATATAAMCNAASDYEELFNKAKKELAQYLQ